MQTENFGADSDDQNLARAAGFKRMVDAAGQEWPDGWVKGEGFVRAWSTDDPMKPPPTVAEVGEEYVRQIVDLSPAEALPRPGSHGHRGRGPGECRAVLAIRPDGGPGQAPCAVSRPPAPSAAER